MSYNFDYWTTCSSFPKFLAAPVFNVVCNVSALIAASSHSQHWHNQFTFCQPLHFLLSKRRQIFLSFCSTCVRCAYFCALPAAAQVFSNLFLSLLRPQFFSQHQAQILIFFPCFSDVLTQTSKSWEDRGSSLVWERYKNRRALTQQLNRSHASSVGIFWFILFQSFSSEILHFSVATRHQQKLDAQHLEVILYSKPAQSVVKISELAHPEIML